jgi:hypothetical protein
MTITIGIDPHKGSHTAVAIDSNEHVSTRPAFDRVPPKLSIYASGLAGSGNERGRSSRPEASAASSPNSSSQPAKT